jgi:hypothetical protein
VGVADRDRHSRNDGPPRHGGGGERQVDERCRRSAMPNPSRISNATGGDMASPAAIEEGCFTTAR